MSPKSCCLPRRRAGVQGALRCVVLGSFFLMLWRQLRGPTQRLAPQWGQWVKPDWQKEVQTASRPGGLPQVTQCVQTPSPPVTASAGTGTGVPRGARPYLKSRQSVRPAQSLMVQSEMAQSGKEAWRAASRCLHEGVGAGPPSSLPCGHGLPAGGQGSWCPLASSPP